MIDMSHLHSHPGYATALANFNNSSARKRWKKFKPVHLKVTNDRCPICECLVDGSASRSTSSGEQTVIKATIDHYRPQDQNYYPFLAYEHTNYILMCSECNSCYKGNEFPLYGSQARATDTQGLVYEKPLIVNPIYSYSLSKCYT